MHITSKTNHTIYPISILLLALLLCLLSLTPSASALSCASIGHKLTPEEQVANLGENTPIYLAKLVHVKREQLLDQNSNQGAGKFVYTGTLEVVKIYRGNIEKISQITQAQLIYHCHRVWGPPCIPAANFQTGEYYILLQDNNPVISSGGLCSTNNDPAGLITDLNELKPLEEKMPPIWTKE